MQRWFLVLTYIITLSLSVPAQQLPRNYFRNPMDIVPMELAANFGELRPNHWHMGLDIRTNAKENYPVHAAAEGYIAHVGIRPQSFGRFIIIDHPNGLSTLYAHLNDFYPALEDFVTAKQHEKESWAIELDFTPEQFRVTKGAFIAYSGNTGGSQGPHLHFEIIETRTDKRLNPLLFSFPLKDEVPPSLVKLALYDRSKSVYDQTPQFFNLKNTDSGYIIPKIPVLRTGLNRISLGIQAYDRLSGSNNPNGIYSAHLYLDEEPQVAFILDSINYNETVYMNAHIDYKWRYNGGAFIQHLSQLPGDHGTAYKKINSDGVIQLQDTSLHAIRVDVRDPAGNLSQLSFFLQYDDSLAKEVKRFNGSVTFAPNQAQLLEKPGFEFYLPSKGLYDTASSVYYTTSTQSSYTFSDVHQVGDAAIPLHDDAIVRLKLKKQVPAEWQDKLLIVRGDRKGRTIRKANWEEQWLSAKFGDFGSFQVQADAIGPQINELGKGDTVDLSPATRIIFTPTDNFGIKSFRAELYSCPSDTSGHLCAADATLPYKWLRFTNDKSRNWIYKFDEHCPYGVHRLKVTVEDLVGNKATKEWWFKRYPYTPPPKKKAKKPSSKKKTTTTKKTSTKKTTTKKKK